MSALAARIFVAIDEWLGWTLVVVLYLAHEPAWRVALPVHLLVTYAFVYPLYWRAHDPWWRRYDGYTMKAANSICRHCHRLRPVNGARYCAACSAELRAMERRRPAANDTAAPTEPLFVLPEIEEPPEAS